MAQALLFNRTEGIGIWDSIRTILVQCNEGLPVPVSTTEGI